MPLRHRTTLTQYLIEERRRFPASSGDFNALILDVALACKAIARAVAMGELGGMYGDQAADGGKSINVQGETQKKLDVLSNDLFIRMNEWAGHLAGMASEEMDDPYQIQTQFPRGKYMLVFDPLDGSSNIDSGLPTGTIFGVYRDPKFGPKEPVLTIKQRGRQLVAAGYCLYSASCHLVITMRSGLHMFTLDDSTGEFYLTRSNIRMPRSGPTYSFNDVYASEWEPGVRTFLQDLKAKQLTGFSAEVNAKKKPTARYMGALVADAHNIIMNGGIFGYPGTINKPKGKLRLLYEANPLALVMEEAGGMASNGRTRILDLTVDDIHQRTPLFIGSVDEVMALERYQKFFSFPEE